VETVPSRPVVPAEANPWRDEFVKAYKIMLLSRTLDEKLGNLYRAGKSRVAVCTCGKVRRL